MGNKIKTESQTFKETKRKKYTQPIHPKNQIRVKIDKHAHNDTIPKGLSGPDTSHRQSNKQSKNNHYKSKPTSQSLRDH